MREYWEAMKEATLRSLALHVTSLLRPQRQKISLMTTQPTSAGQGTTKQQGPQRKSTLGGSRSGMHNKRSRTNSGPSTVSRNPSGTRVMAINTCILPIEAVSSPIARMDSLSMIDNEPLCWVCRQEDYPTSQGPFMRDNQRERFNNVRGSNIKAYMPRNNCNNDRRGQERGRSNRESHRGGSSQETTASANDQGGSASTNPNAGSKAKK